MLVSVSVSGEVTKQEVSFLSRRKPVFAGTGPIRSDDWSVKSKRGQSTILDKGRMLRTPEPELVAEMSGLIRSDNSAVSAHDDVPYANSRRSSTPTQGQRGSRSQGGSESKSPLRHIQESLRFL